MKVEILAKIQLMLEDVESQGYGEVVVKFQDGRIVLLEKKEKYRVCELSTDSEER